MGQITPQMVKELRGKTGVGMGDCKNALVESDGNIKEAIEYLRKKGAASMAKRQDRSANEGLIVVKTSDDGKLASIVEINCETDFVARNEQFVAYSDSIADAVLSNEPANVAELLRLKINNDTVQGMHNEILAKFSEKIEIKRFEKICTEGFVASYTHVGSRLAVLIEMSEPNPTENAISHINDIAMQIAAMNPEFIDRDSVPSEHLEKEKEIYREAAIQEGKKPEIADRVAIGKIEKFFQEQCLIEQQFVKDSAKKVKDVVKEISDDYGKEVSIKCFKRYFLGESSE